MNSLEKPMVFAHRGSSAYAPENTMSAFDLAISQGADAIELDTKLSADNIPVVIHDSSVDRTTNGTGNVARLTYRELRNLDAGSSFDKIFSGERIPSLEEVLITYSEKIIINIELTNYRSPSNNLPERVSQLIKILNVPHYNLLVSSFNPISLIKFNAKLPDIRIGLLTLGGLLGLWVNTPLSRLVHKEAIHPNKDIVSQRYIAQQHHKGLKVRAYTVNEEEIMKRFFSWGIDGIFTDDPLKALKLLGKSQI